MFDPVTAAFVRASAPLPGLNPASLVDELTAAYVDIAAARLALSSEQAQAPDLRPLVDRMSRLADTYEAQIVLDVNNERRRSMAFVAGSARQVLTQIEKLTPSFERPTNLNDKVIGPEISAALLFLIAQRSSDAYEASREIRAAGEANAVRRALILAIGRFARGQFESLLEIDAESEKLDSSERAEFAADLLFREILRGLRILARVGLGRLNSDAIFQALITFRKVQELSIDQANFDNFDLKIGSISVFAGPHHLAALLERAAGSFGQDLLVSIPPPSGADAQRWDDWLKSEASRWPFLWENHRDAIATGYLHRGWSLVMTTPTGSGKTTLAALKIAATLAHGKTVLYLAPTHALVGQVENDLNERVVGLAKARSIEEISLDETIQTLPDIAVVTPERCFALLTFAPEIFASVGLLVFDEFHLLGVNAPTGELKDIRVDRRAIDAMLCLLTFQSINTGADYLLLSAMVSNGAEVAEWLSAVIGRPVINFDYKWKPTRQLRSCVIYDKAEMFTQRRSLGASPPIRKPAAIPYGMFSLSSGWNPGAPDKILVRPLASHPVALGHTKNRFGPYLTANRFEVATVIAHRFATRGLKVIVFCDSIVNCVSVAKALNKLSTPFESQRDEDQERLRETAVSELGHEGAIYDAGMEVAAVHHGELLPSERRLVESLFRRRDSGVRVLAATSTLAQGLNLPCDVVILASIDRLDDSDPEEKGRIRLKAHEILNALGRAGRAGQAATGYSIVVPGRPTECDMNTQHVAHDEDLALVFADGDQCLPISDPLTVLFDIIEVNGVVGDDADYLLRRLTVSLGEERAGVETFESLTRRTFGYYQKRKADPTAADIWLKKRKATLEKALMESASPDPQPWQEELAAKTGASTKFIAKLAAAFAGAPVDAVDASTWVFWLLGQLDPADKDTDIFLKPDSMTRVFGRAITRQVSDAARRKIAVEGTRIALASWFAGDSLCEMESALAAFVAANEGAVSRPTVADRKSKRARRFALRIASDFGFLCGILSQVAQKICTDNGVTAPPMIGFLPQLTRYGFETPYHFALSRNGDQNSRRAARQAFAALAANIELVATDDWNLIRAKLTNAEAMSLFATNEPDNVALNEEFIVIVEKEGDG